MKTFLAALSLVTLAACGTAGQTDGGVGTDPGSPSHDPAGIPSAPGTVHSRGLVTVMDNGGPELCLGPVAESYPPQCDGPSIEGWDWADRHGMFEHQGKVRWGQFAVSGTWDGETFTLTGAIPAPVYDALPAKQPTVPKTERHYTQAQLERIAEKVGHDLPGALGAFARHGHVLADVVYDDGSLQSQVDRQYGAGVVVLVSSLVDEKG
jgi:hypothetical protein